MTTEDVKKYYEYWQKNNLVKLDCREEGHREHNHVSYDAATDMHVISCDLCGSVLPLGALGIKCMEDFFNTKQQPNIK